ARTLFDRLTGPEVAEGRGASRSRQHATNAKAFVGYHLQAPIQPRQLGDRTSMFDGRLGASIRGVSQRRGGPITVLPQKLPLPNVELGLADLFGLGGRPTCGFGRAVAC